MRPRRRSAGCLLVVLVAFVGACLALAVAFQAGTSSLGTPARGLSTVERTALAAYLMLNRRGLTTPAGDPQRAATLDIEQGQEARPAGDRMEEQGNVAPRPLFSRYLTYRGLNTGIEACRYEVSGAMSILELSELLQQARSSR